MQVRARLHELFARLGRTSWETRIALAVPLLIGLLAIPVLLGAFAGAAPGDNPGYGGYGGPPSTLPVTVTKPPQAPPPNCSPHSRSPFCP